MAKWVDGVNWGDVGSISWPAHVTNPLLIRVWVRKDASTLRLSPPADPPMRASVTQSSHYQQGRGCWQTAGCRHWPHSPSEKGRLPVSGKIPLWLCVSPSWVATSLFPSLACIIMEGEMKRNTGPWYLLLGVLTNAGPHVWSAVWLRGWQMAFRKLFKPTLLSAGHEAGIVMFSVRW